MMPNSGAKARRGVRFALFAATVCCVGPMPTTAAAEDFYVRGGIGYEDSARTTVRDVDCAAVSPPALFGCGSGIDGLPLGARGDFRGSLSLDAGIGYRLSSTFRAELMLSYRPDFNLEANANFRGVAGEQPVFGSLETLNGLLVGYVDLPSLGLPAFGPIKPYLGAGVGVAVLGMGEVTYRFPSLGANASTVMPGGTTTNLAYMLTAGMALPISERVTVDLGYRFTDFGEVENPTGTAIINRTDRPSRMLEIAGTEADLQTHGLSLSVRFAF